MKFLMVTFLIMISTKSFAGQERGGGATVANPNGGRSLLDLMEQDDLHYFDFKMSDYPTTYGIPSRFTMKEVFGYDIDYNAVFKTALASCLSSGKEFEYLYVGDQTPMHTILYEFYPVTPLKFAFTNTPLEELNDTGVMRVTNPETKRQVAIQTKGLVIINKPEFDSMDNWGKAALKIHEGALCAIKAMNPELIKQQGTAPVREFVRQIASYFRTEYSREATPKYAVSEAVDAMMPKDLPRAMDLESFPGEPDSCSFKFIAKSTDTPKVISRCVIEVGKDSNVFYARRTVVEFAPTVRVLSSGHYTDTTFTTTFDYDSDYTEEDAKVLTYVRKNREKFKEAWIQFVQQSQSVQSRR